MYLLVLRIEPTPSTLRHYLYHFLQIKDGDVDAGIEFYKRHYPKIPDELIEIMARYNFGDLKYATRKSIRNDAKKYAKKNKGKKNLCEGLTIKNEKTFVTFE